MRKFKIILLVVLLTFTFGITGIQAKDELDFSTTSLSELFTKALISDGYVAEAISVELGSRFADNPQNFIQALEKKVYNKDDRQVVIMLLATSLYYEQNETYEKLLNDLKGVVEISSAENGIISDIENIVASHKKIQESYIEIESTFEAPKFSPMKIDKALEEEVFSDSSILVLNRAFKADTKYFLKRLSKESDEKIVKIANVLSKELISNQLESVMLFDSNTEERIYNLVVENMSTTLPAPASESAVRSSYSGRWEIIVYLHVHAWGDRDYVGEGLVLYAPDGSWYWNTTTVLGRSVSGASPLVYRGNTPTGIYEGILAGPMSNTGSYGPNC